MPYEIFVDFCNREFAIYMDCDIKCNALRNVIVSIITWICGSLCLFLLSVC